MIINQRVIFISVSLLFGVFAIVGCNLQSTEPQPIRIGVIAPLTGNIPVIGRSTINAANLAVAEINSAGGLPVDGQTVPVELVIEDSQDQAESAVQAMRRLVNQAGVVAVIGPQASRNAIPAAAIAEAARVPMISPWSTNPDTTAERSYVFRVSFVDSFQSRVMARFTQEELAVTRAAVLFDEASAYNRDLAVLYQQAFEALGGEVVAMETYVTGETDYTRQLETIQQSGAEVLFLPNYYNEVIAQATQAAGVGLDIPLLGSDSWGGLETQGLSLVDGAFFSAHYAPDNQTEAAQTFIRAYQTTYDELPDDVAALTYDAFQILFRIIREAGQADTETIRTGFASLEAFTGATGTIQYQGSGDPIKSAVILRVEDGQTEFYKMANP